MRLPLAPARARPALAVPLMLALLAAALAGCSGQPEPGPATPVPPASQAGARMTIVGLVQNESFVPVPSAAVSLRSTSFATTTDAGGLFSFQVPLAPYLVDVAADGFANQTLTAEPVDNVSLTFILAVPSTAVPPPVVLHFQGFMQCAFEALIISPSCDTLIEFAGGPSVFDDITTFEAGLNPGWATVVLDLDFDEHPGLDGLRLVLQGKNDQDQLGTYEKYGTFHGAAPYSVRVEPGASYDQGTGPMPANATALQLEVYPHSHAYHPACVPVFGCPLGIGTGLNIQFDLFLTIFYVEPAPDGYSHLV